MNKEYEKEIGKDFLSGFLPIVDQKIVNSVSKKFFKATEKDTIEIFYKINKENPEFYKFISYKAEYSPEVCNFLFGSSFVYSAISEKYKETRMPFLQISPKIFEEFSREIEDTNKVFQEKTKIIKQKLSKNIEGNFYTYRYFDKNLEEEFIKIRVDDEEKFVRIIENSNEEYLKIQEEFEKESLSILPSPDYYEKENRWLMGYIKIVSSKIPQIEIAGSFLTGAMMTYEILRRQSESDYLEKKFNF